MALHSSSDVLFTKCSHIKSAHWLVCEQVVGQLAVMLNGLGGDPWSTLPHTWPE